MASSRIFSGHITLVAWLLAAAAVFVSDLTAAGPNPAVIQKYKAITALVDLGEYGSGSAFLAHRKGFFVTNRHVVDHLGLGKTVKLVMNSGSDGQTVLEARVIKMDHERDLALLQVLDLPALDRLRVSIPTMGDERKLVETTSLTVFGYPFGKMLASKGKEYPSISVNTGRVSSLRRKDGKLDFIQLDASINPGNSGGPVINDQGQLVGVIVSGVGSSGVNFAIPIGYVKPLLASPAIVMSTPSIRFADRGKAIDYKVELVPIDAPPGQVALEAEFTAGKDDVRKFKAALRGKQFEFSAAALPVPLKPIRLHVEATDGTTAVQFNVPDLTVTLDGQPIQLSEIRKITQAGGRAEVVTVYRVHEEAERRPIRSIRFGGLDEDEDVGYVVRKGAISGLDQAGVYVGRASIELADAKQIIVRSFDPGPVEVEYTVRAKRGTKEVAVAKGAIELKHAPASFGGHGAGLLQVVDIARDRISGQWSRVGASLETSAADAGRLVLPARPGGRYEIEMDFEYLAGSKPSLQLKLPIGKTAALLRIEGGVDGFVGLEMVKGKSVADSQAKLAIPSFKSEERQSLRAVVQYDEERAYISARVGFGDRFEWQGRLEELSLPKDWKGQDDGMFVLGQSGAHFRIRGFHVHSYDGVVRIMKDRVPRVSLSRDALVARWEFEEVRKGSTHGPLMIDSKGHHHLPPHGGAAPAPGGIEGKGLRLDGKNALVILTDCPHINQSPLKQRSIMAWFKVTNKTIRSRNQVIIDEGGKDSGLAIYIHQGSLYVGGWANASRAGGWRGTFLSTDQIKSGRWHHVALVLDGEARQPSEGFTGYLDGKRFGLGR
ncbi:MAG: trypsin-like peptidase domain-containing protein, partial [Phycisphaerae bacterium]|nr:trypsin-like peptidase domain-containing protein [Phycisphaerae bacterium]